jgi:serine/threonine protein kinase
MTENIGRYQILEEIGRGGFAIVHRARDTRLGREVALKELRPVLLDDAGWVERFQLEARAIAHLDHPQIVPIYDVYNSDKRLFLVMRLVNGPSLLDLISSRAHIPWAETVDTVEKVAVGLDYAHHQGILHRDLKPANVLVDVDRGPMLSDFGLAKLIGDHSSTLSASGSVVGTPHYIAPEVWEGKGHSPQSDIYALGCVLFEMITGEKVFKGQTPPVVMMAHFQPIALPDIWPEGVPPAVADVFHQALATNPADRFENAEQLARALKALTSESQPRVTVQASERPEAIAAAAPMPPLPASEPGDFTFDDEFDDANRSGRETVAEAFAYEDDTEESAFSITEDDEFDGEEEEGATWSGFVAHLGPYIIVIGMLAVINMITSPDSLWFLFPAIAWGIGLAFHLRNVLLGTTVARLPDHWRSFADHFSAYAIVISALALINLVASPSEMWFQWPAMGWGIGLGIHFWFTLLGKTMDDKSDKGWHKARKKWRKERRKERYWPAARARKPENTTTRAETTPPATFNPTLQAQMDKAQAYRRQINELARTNSSPQIQSNVREMADQVNQWTQAVEELARRINRFQQNELIQHDLSSVPQAIEKLETRLKTEEDPTTRTEVERALNNRRNQWKTLKSLQNTMVRAELKIENTLSLLGTLYPQILSSQSTNQVSDYSRITGEVSEEVRVLKDHLDALEEVKLGRANNYTG